jgi:hypothetical protein
MSKNFNSKSMDELFNLSNDDDIEIESLEVEETNEIILDDQLNNNSKDGKENKVEEDLSKLLNTANQLLEAAKFSVETTPDDSEAVASAAALINSIGSLIGEFNKSVLINKKHNNSLELEKEKNKYRKELIELKAKLTPSLGSGNTINIQNNNALPFAQESIVEKIIEMEKQEQKTIDVPNNIKNIED